MSVSCQFDRFPSRGHTRPLLDMKRVVLGKDLRRVSWYFRIRTAAKKASGVLNRRVVTVWFRARQ
jgi:hypothetical protein